MKVLRNALFLDTLHPAENKAVYAQNSGWLLKLSISTVTDIDAA
jgi:hypothetical protein